MQFNKLGKLHLHPQKRMFANNLHHKTQAKIMGSDMMDFKQPPPTEQASVNEYHKNYEDTLQKFMQQKQDQIAPGGYSAQ
jgi:hypothetical protein